MDLVELSGLPVRRHPWEEARFQFFFRVLAGSIDIDARTSVLDVGAGDAWFARQLAERTAARRIVCWDSGYTSEFLADRQLPQGSGIELSTERPSEHFDLLLFLDVLEHVAADDAFLRELVCENLAPGGHVLVSVPAWPWLFSSHDVRLHHYRRYTPGSARNLLHGAGLEIIRSAGLFHALLLPRAFQVAREHLTGRARPPANLGQWKAPPLITALVRGALAGDASLSLAESRVGLSIPGLSWWALCRRTTG